MEEIDFGSHHLQAMEQWKPTKGPLICLISIEFLWVHRKDVSNGY